MAEAGVLFGRTDVGALIEADAIARTRSLLPKISRIVTSPARRCRETAAAVFPGGVIEGDARLWEQDFGRHDGLRFADLPDLGTLSRDALAAYRPPEGESFADLSARIAPALSDYASEASSAGADMALVVHAGVIRAALGLTLGDAALGLGFEVGTLSVTTLRVGSEGPFAVIAASAT